MIKKMGFFSYCFKDKRKVPFSFGSSSKEIYIPDLEIAQVNILH